MKDLQSEYSLTPEISGAQCDKQRHIQMKKKDKAGFFVEQGETKIEIRC